MNRARRLLLSLSLFSLGALACEVQKADDEADGTDDGKADAATTTGDAADSSSGGNGGAGNLPCPGCAGDPCEAHGDCLDGFICTRVDDDTAFCTNCTASAFDPRAPDECVSECNADLQCWQGGVCDGGLCLHGCGNDSDCPSGHTCRSSGTCVPAGLPELGEPCVAEEAYLCALDGPSDYGCIFGYEGDQLAETWCSKPCTEDLDCTDVWVSGCCATLPPDGSPWCVPFEYCGAGAICENTCMYMGDGECDDGGPGSDYDVCGYGTDCADCGPRG